MVTTLPTTNGGSESALCMLNLRAAARIFLAACSLVLLVWRSAFPLGDSKAGAFSGDSGLGPTLDLLVRALGSGVDVSASCRLGGLSSDDGDGEEAESVGRIRAVGVQ